MAFRSSYRPVDNSSLFATFLTKPTCNLRAWFPVFQHPTTFKPFGAPDDNGGIQSWRVDDEYDGFSDWIHGFHIVTKAGTERRVTFVADLKDGSDFGDETPYTRLLTVVKQLSRTKNPDYENLLKNVNQQSPAVPKVENALAMQGMLLMHGGKNYMTNPVADMFLVLVKTAHDALLEKLNERSMNPMAPNRDDRWASGNVVDPTSGKVIQVYAAGQSVGPAKVNWNAASSGGGAAESKGKDFSRYDANITDMGAPAQPLTDLMRNHYRPWGDVFRHLEAGEMVEILCSAYKPDLIAKAFLNSAFEDLVPQRIRSKFAPGSHVGGYLPTPNQTPAAPIPPINNVAATTPIPQANVSYFNTMSSQSIPEDHGSGVEGPQSTDATINTLKAMAERLRNKGQ